MVVIAIVRIEVVQSWCFRVQTDTSSQRQPFGHVEGHVQSWRQGRRADIAEGLHSLESSTCHNAQVAPLGILPCEVIF